MRDGSEVLALSWHSLRSHIIIPGDAVFAFDNERTHAVLLLSRLLGIVHLHLCKDSEDVGGASVADPNFAAVEHVVLATR